MTIFECRCCGKYCVGDTSGRFFPLNPGEVWRRIANIDGPDAICGDCAGDADCLDNLIEDGYEHASIVVNS